MEIPWARATVLLALVGAKGWTGTPRQRAADFPAATITSDSAGGSAVGRQSRRLDVPARLLRRGRALRAEQGAGPT